MRFVENSEQAGMGVVLAIPIANAAAQSNINEMEWACFQYLNEQLVPFDAISFFGKWIGNRGRANINKRVWDEDVDTRFGDIDDANLTAMVMHRLFIMALKS